MSKSPVSMDLSKVFVVLEPSMSVSQESVRPGLYEALDAAYDGFRNHALISCHDFSEDWGSWERHPEGDEIVVLLSGNATMVLWQHESEELVELELPGSYVVVPRGIWHTARVSVPTKMIFITPGQNTQHAESPVEGA